VTEVHGSGNLPYRVQEIALVKLWKFERDVGWLWARLEEWRVDQDKTGLGSARTNIEQGIVFMRFCRILHAVRWANLLRNLRDRFPLLQADSSLFELLSIFLPVVEWPIFAKLQPKTATTGLPENHDQAVCRPHMCCFTKRKY
jgi:hypothetical protein